MENSINFKHSIQAQLRFSDVDQYGHVNNSVYFSLYDLAKTSYFEEITDNRMDWKTVGVVVANIQANFLSPIFFNENIAIQTAVSHIGNKSFTITQQAINSDTKEVKCICQTIMVGYDINTKESMLIPEEFKRMACEYEQNEALLQAKPATN